MPPDLKADWVPLSSSNVRAARYDPDTQTLSVEFLYGGAYEYYDVPQAVADGLFNSSSPGRFIKDELRGYAYARA